MGWPYLYCFGYFWSGVTPFPWRPSLKQLVLVLRVGLLHVLLASNQFTRYSPGVRRYSLGYAQYNRSLLWLGYYLWLWVGGGGDRVVLYNLYYVLYGPKWRRGLISRYESQRTSPLPKRSSKLSSRVWVDTYLTATLALFGSPARSSISSFSWETEPVVQGAMYRPRLDFMCGVIGFKYLQDAIWGF